MVQPKHQAPSQPLRLPPSPRWCLAPAASVLTLGVLTAGLLLPIAAPAHGQNVADAIRQRAQARQASEAEARRIAEAKAQAERTLARLAQPMTNVDLQEQPFKDALAWWHQQTGVNLVIDWEDAELQGADPTAPVTLQVTGLPAAKVLLLITDQATSAELPLATFIAEVHDNDVELMTKGQANRRLETVVYDVSHEVIRTFDHFHNAPNFDLANIGQQQGGGSGSGGGNQNIFDNSNNASDNDTTKTPAENGDELATMLRQTIEPDLWLENGGTVARMVYQRQRLIVRAPAYVQDQINLPVLHSSPRPRK